MFINKAMSFSNKTIRGKIKKYACLFIIIIFLAYCLITLLTGQLCSQSALKQIKRATLWNLRAIYSLQNNFKTLCIKDTNNNKIGEFANLYDLIEGFNKIIPSVDEIYLISYGNKSISLRFVSPHQGGGSSGYGFLFFLPSDPTLSEKHWCCYAISNDYPKTGRETYFINESGKIWQSAKEPYGINLTKTPNVGNAYKNEPFISAIDETKWELTEDIPNR